MSCSVHHISHNRTCSRKFASSASIEHRISQNISMHKNCIKYIVDAVQRTFRSNQEWCHHCIKAIVYFSAGSQQFDGFTHLFGIFHINSRNLRDSLCVYFFKIYKLTKCKCGQNCDLTACVVTLNIRSRICLCISFCLCILQYFVKVRTFHAHLCHHVVCRSVEDSCDLVNLICCQRGIQRTNDRNTASAACLKQEIDVLCFCNFHQFHTKLGYQRFVGCCHALSCFQTAFDKCVSRFQPSHCLNYNFHFRIIDNLLKIMNDQMLCRISWKFSQIQNIFNIDFFPNTFVNTVMVGIDNLYHTTSNSTISHYSNINHTFYSLPSIFK